MLVMLEICLKALSRCRDSCRKCPALYINHSLKRPCQSVDVSGYFQSYYSNFQSDSTVPIWKQPVFLRPYWPHLYLIQWYSILPNPFYSWARTIWYNSKRFFSCAILMGVMCNVYPVSYQGLFLQRALNFVNTFSLDLDYQRSQCYEECSETPSFHEKTSSLACPGKRALDSCILGKSSM